MGSNWRSNSSPRGGGPRSGPEGVNGISANPLTGLRPELPLMGSNWLPNSSPQGEVDRGKAPGRRGSAEMPLTPSVGFADSSP